MVNWKELPYYVQWFMLQEQKKQTGKKSASLFKVNVYSRKKNGGFDWEESILGKEYWVNTLCKRKFTLPIYVQTYVEEGSETELFIEELYRQSGEINAYFKLKILCPPNQDGYYAMFYPYKKHRLPVFSLYEFNECLHIPAPVLFNVYLGEKVEVINPLDMLEKFIAKL